jgi:hypothetical protein
MTNPKPNSAFNAHRPAVTPPFGRSKTIVMAASIVVSISGGCLVPFNPVLARMPDSMPLASGVAPSLVTNGANLPTSLVLARSLVTSDRLVPQASPADPIRDFWRRVFRFFFFQPADPI